MFGARLFYSIHPGPAAPQRHSIYDNDAEPSLSELLADPVTLALATSDGLSACELETFIADITGKLKDNA